MSNRRQPIRNPFARDFSEPPPPPPPRPVPTTIRNDQLTPEPSRINIPSPNFPTPQPTPSTSNKPIFSMNINNQLFTHINPSLFPQQQQQQQQLSCEPPKAPSTSQILQTNSAQNNNILSTTTSNEEQTVQNDFTMYSSSDYLPYVLPIELVLGKLKTTTDYYRYEKLADTPTCKVYRGRDLRAKRTIAMKIVQQQHDEDGQSEKKIFREISLLKTLEHTNIIKLIDVVGLEIDNLYLIFEYCSCSVAKFIDRYPKDRVISTSEIKYTMKCLLKGLDYLHSNFIIHRDIKTSNLVISKEGIVKIIDFGLSRRYTNTSYGTPMTPHVGTRWYQAPEILLESPTYDEKVDIWSVGCVLAELLFKKPLLPGESQIDQINLIIDLLGSPNPNIWPGYEKCKIPKSIYFRQQPFNKLEERLNDIGRVEPLDLLRDLLQYDPCKRISAHDALQDDFMGRAPRAAPKIDLTGIITFQEEIG